MPVSCWGVESWSHGQVAIATLFSHAHSLSCWTPCSQHRVKYALDIISWFTVILTSFLLKPTSSFRETFSCMPLWGWVVGFHELVVIFQVSWVVPWSRDAGIGECVCTQFYSVCSAIHKVKSNSLVWRSGFFTLIEGLLTLPLISFRRQSILVFY